MSWRSRHKAAAIGIALTLLLYLLSCNVHVNKSKFFANMYPSNNHSNTLLQEILSLPSRMHNSSPIESKMENQESTIKSRIEIPELSIESKVTVLIKTMNRPGKVRTLVESIEAFYLKQLKIIIGDDGPLNQTHHYYNQSIVDGNRITYKYFGYDIGLSASRNILVQLSGSEYSIISDDDMIWNQQTDIHKLLRVIMKANADIVTMSLRESGTSYHYHGKLYLENNLIIFCKQDYSSKEKKCPNLEPREIVPEYGCYETDIGLNMFIARTNFLARHPWDEKLKVREHEPWYWSLQESSEVARIFGCVGVEVEHNNGGVKPEGYGAMRNRKFKSHFQFNMKYNDEHDPKCCKLAEQRRNNSRTGK